MATLLGFINVSVDQNALESWIRIGATKHFNEQMDLDLPDSTIETMGMAYAAKVSEAVEEAVAKADQSLWDLITQGKAADLDFGDFVGLMNQFKENKQSSEALFNTVEDLFNARRRGPKK